MKIAFLHSIYKPYARGGAEVVAQNIVEGLKKRGEDVFVISLGRQNKIEEIDGVKVYRLKSFNLFNFLDINRQPVWLRLPWHLIDMFNFIQTKKIKNILLEEKPDLVFMQGLKGLSYWLPRTLKKMKIKHLYRVFDMQLIHPTGLLFDNENRFTAALARVYKMFCRWLFDSPELVVFPSHYVKSVYESNNFFKKSRKEVWPNPVVFSQSFTAGDRSKQSPDTFNILFLGQVEEYKGIFKLIEAIGGLEGDWALNVVGDGQALPEAKNRALECHKIKFWGRLSQVELEENIWPITDLLVNPSQVPETFGLVVAEANAHCVPTLVAGRGALPELVQEGETGWVEVNGNWRGKIKWCLDNRSALSVMRQSCMRQAQKYDLENYLNKLLEFGKMGE